MADVYRLPVANPKYPQCPHCHRDLPKTLKEIRIMAPPDALGFLKLREVELTLDVECLCGNILRLAPGFTV